jgi:hypothetical protein
MTDYSLTHEERTKITTEMLCDWINNTERLLNVIREIVEESKRLPMVEDIDRMWHKRLRELLRTACAQMTKAGLNVPDHNTNCYWVQVLEHFEGDAGRCGTAALERYQKEY